MKRDILTQFAILLVKIYKFFISPIFPPSCRFYPSCSEYSIQAFSKYGFFKGLWLSTKRIIRCNPFNPGGIDEVP
ncbi:MAG: membrane protein insertion efficiency factor YidD [Candidatus Kryptonium sp.]|nr:membrane protein insertion efficiency factor YidD [Candidatus Kryptonium sp.]MCX7762435.1 membrane protein insertion efficiency factor YidD [Candidatus Kryptonium sp.]MDW8109938.1 membrane protein insertion efficiency factor YidD [Candidatus Kryptonium sp.]